MKIFTKLLCAAALLVTGQQASAQTLLDNFETTRLVDYPAAQGVLTQAVANPFSGTGNTSTLVARFVRSATDAYSTIAIRPKNNGTFASVAAYRSGAQRLSMKFLSPGPGTQVQIVLQNAAKVAYPLGNYAGDFFATTTAAANTWETLSFTFAAGVSGTTFDPTVTATDVDQIAVLIAPGSTNNGATYYFDDLMGPAVATATATRSAQTSTAAFSVAYPNPASGLTLLPYSMQESAVVSLAVFDSMGRRVAQVLDQQRQPAGQFQAELNAARLAPGLYTCRLLVNGASLTRQLSVQ